MFKRTTAAILTIAFCITFVCACAPADTGGEATASPSASRTPAPVDLNAELSAITGQATVYYSLGPTFTGQMEQKEKRVDIAPYIKLLLENPIYNESDLPVDIGVMMLSVERNPIQMALTESGKVLIDLHQKRYVCFSKELFDKILALTETKQYKRNDLKNVKSITFSRKSITKTVTIVDAPTIQKITGLLAASDFVSFSLYYRKVDVQMILHTDDGDIVCYFSGSPIEIQDEAFQINRIYSYRSKEFLEYVRSLLK